MKTFNLTLCLILACSLAAVSQSIPSYVPTNGLVGWFPFNGNANDESGNGYLGTVSGATITTDRFGNPNSAYQFNISNQITSNCPGVAGSGSRTISFWFKPDALNNTTNIWVLAGYGSGGYPGCAFGATYRQNNLGTDISSAYAYYNNSIPTSGWSFASYVYSSNYGTNVTSIKIYINGVLQTTTSSTLGTSVVVNTGSSNWFFGKADPLQSFQGKIDDIGIWNRALTQQEITALYTSLGPCTKPEPVTLGVDKTTVRCPNDNVTIFIVTPSDPGLTYQWTRNGTNIVGATASSISVSDAAKYKVFVRSGPGIDCQRVSGLIETTAAIPPTITATTPNGNAYCPGDSVLLSATGATAGYSYQWKRFGVPIAGATSASLYATQTGNYRCEVTNAGGCINQSNLITVTAGTSCRIAQSAIGDVSVYPNPARNSFTVSFNDIGNETPTSVELRNQNGQVIQSKKTKSLEDVVFNTQHLSPGTYHVRVMLESGDPMEKTVQVIQ